MVITMSHAWVERSLWLPWPFHQLHFPPLLHLYLQAQPPALQLPWGKVVNPLCTLAKEMGSNDDNFSLTGYISARTYFLTETYVEFNQEPVTEQRFPEDMDFVDAAIGQMLFNAYRRQVDHSEREGLSSGRQCLRIERGNPLWTVTKVTIERGNPLWKVTNRLGLFWTGKESKSSLTARRRLENTNSKLIMTEEVYKH